MFEFINAHHVFESITPTRNEIRFTTDRAKVANSVLKVESSGNSESISRSFKKSFAVPLQAYYSINPTGSSSPGSIKPTGSNSPGSAGTNTNITNSPYAGQAIPMDVLERCRKQFVKVARSDQIEYGYGSASEALLEKFFEEYKSNIGTIVQHIYLSESSNARVLIPLLKAVGNFDYHDVYPYAQMMATAALTNVDPEVREAGIRAFENWEDPAGAAALKNVETPWPWLNSYRLETIAYLETFA